MDNCDICHSESKDDLILRKNKIKEELQEKTKILQKLEKEISILDDKLKTPNNDTLNKLAKQYKKLFNTSTEIKCLVNYSISLNSHTLRLQEDIIFNVNELYSIKGSHYASDFHFKNLLTEITDHIVDLKQDIINFKIDFNNAKEQYKLSEYELTAIVQEHIRKGK